MPGSAHKGIYEPPDSTYSVTINHDVSRAGDFPVLQFPSPGRVVSAHLVAKNTAAGTNILKVGLKNGGAIAGGIGTVVIAPPVPSDGLVRSGSAYAMTVATDGKEQFSAGDWLVLDVTAVMTPNPGCAAVVNYHLDAF